MAKAWRCALCHLTAPDVVRSKRKRDLCDLCYDGLEARGLAWCCRCNRRKQQDEMAHGGSFCRECDKKRRDRSPEALARKAADQRERLAKNRETINARRRIRQAERVKQKRDWRRRNIERAREYSRAYYWRNREQRIAKNRAWRAANTELSRAITRNSKIRRKLAILQSWRRAA